MTEKSELCASPTPDYEETYIKQLKSIKETLLSKTHSESLAPESLNDLWENVIDIVKNLQNIRSEKKCPLDYTETDTVLEEVAPMFVQYWSKNGDISESMVQIYVDLMKCHSMLTAVYEHSYFVETDIFTHKEELLRIDANMRSLLKDKHNSDESQSKQHTHGVSLLNNKLKSCVKLLNKLYEELATIAPQLLPVYNRLIQIHHSLVELQKQPSHLFLLTDVQVLQAELAEIDSARIDGAYVARDGTIISGQARVIEVMEDCYEIAHELLCSRDEVDGENPLRYTYEKLIGIKGRLESLRVTRKWMPNEHGDDEILSIQLQLGEIDNLRVDGKFVDEDGNVPPGQAVLHLLLHKCYRLVRKLQMDHEPVVQELMEIKNQLETLNKCLEQLVKWKVSLDDDELVPYQLKIASIDNMRVDGKFMVDGEVPEGQGILHTLLHECYEKLSELKS